MKIQYCSDLHLEFPENRHFIDSNFLVPGGDILVIAGDMVTLCDQHRARDFIDFASDHFAAVYWVPGNHEYYDSDIADRPERFMERIRDNFFLVNNQSIVYEGVRLVFSTLWGRIAPERSDELERCISDFSQIRYKGGKFSPTAFTGLHEASLGFLSDILQTRGPEPTVIVTHHVPTLTNYPRKYRKSTLSEAFVTDLPDLVSNSGATAWIYGHHHVNVDAFYLGATKMLTNQLGYVRHYEHKSFRRDAILEIAAP